MTVICLWRSLNEGLAPICYNFHIYYDQLYIIRTTNIIVNLQYFYIVKRPSYYRCKIYFYRVFYWYVVQHVAYHAMVIYFCFIFIKTARSEWWWKFHLTDNHGFIFREFLYQADIWVSYTGFWLKCELI